MKRDRSRYEGQGNIRQGARIVTPYRGSVGVTALTYQGMKRNTSQYRRLTTQVVANMPETKYYDVSGSDTPTNNANSWADTEVIALSYINSSGNGASATAGNCCLIPTVIGTGYGQVQGNRYNIKTLRVRGSLQPANGATGSVALSAYKVRLLLVMDTMPNGVQAQGEEVMQDMGDADRNVHSFANMANFAGRFRILKDKKYIFQPQVLANNAATSGNLTQGWQAINYKLQWKPVVPFPVTIKSGTSTPNVAATVNCNIFLLQLATIDGTIVGQVLNSLVSRTYYTDN